MKLFLLPLIALLPLSLLTPSALAQEEKEAEKPSKEEKSEPDDEKKPGPPKSMPDDVRAMERYSREAEDIAKGWQGASDSVRQSVVQLVIKNKQIALACQVHADGMLLSKASELRDRKGKALEGIEAVFPEGLRLPVQISDVHPQYDLALLRVPARGLRPIKWATENKTAPGTFIAAVEPSGKAVAFGVVSVLPRSLDESHKGYLGVQLEIAEKGIRVSHVGAKSPADEAGLKTDDIVTSIEGKEVTNVADCIRNIAACRPYQEIRIGITRAGAKEEIKAKLKSRAENVGTREEDMRNFMAGRLSEQRGNYPEALQHDMVLQPYECGGPIVDLEGHVLGINIARSGRIESLAIPSNVLNDLLKTAGNGHFSRPELDQLRRDRATLEREADRLREEIETLRSQIDEAEGKKPEAKKEEKREET